MTIYGVDVSRWNKVDWPALRNKIAFAGYRVTWSTGGVDSVWQSHLTGAQGLDALPIAYHVLDPHVSPVDQVGHFLKTLGKDTGGAWMLDVEPSPKQKPAPPAQWADAAAAWCYELSARVGAPPLLYGSPTFLGALHLSGDLDGAPLWLAAWRNGSEDEAKRPAVAVKPWRRVTIWQVGTRPQPDGSVVDWDRYEGTREDLERELCIGLTHAPRG